MNLKCSDFNWFGRRGDRFYLGGHTLGQGFQIRWRMNGKTSECRIAQTWAILNWTDESDFNVTSSHPESSRKMYSHTRPNLFQHSVSSDWNSSMQNQHNEQWCIMANRISFAHRHRWIEMCTWVVRTGRNEQKTTIIRENETLDDTRYDCDQPLMAKQ